MNGFVKLDRKTMLESGILQNPHALQVMIYCLLHAAYEEKTVLFDGRAVALKPGELVVSRKILANALGLTDREIRTSIKTLENVQLTTNRTTNAYTIISINNFDGSKNLFTTNDQQKAKRPTSKRPAERPTNDQPSYKEEEIRNKNKEENTYCASPDAQQANPPVGSSAWKKKMRAETFEQFWDAFAYKRGRGGAEKAWNAIPRLTEELLAKILEAARKEAAQRQALIDSGRTPKMAQGWITERRWEDDYDTSGQVPIRKSWAEIEEDKNREEFLRMVRERREREQREASNG